MNDWKYKIGDVLRMGKDSCFVIIGTREEQCSAGTQRFYLGHHVLKSFGAGVGMTAPVLVVPDVVLDEMVRMGKGGEEG